ncbi:MAG TPA: alpha-mannosidase, partial [Edaphobacter sp.]
MISRRKFLQRTSAAYVLSTAPITKVVEAAVVDTKQEDLLQWVDARIGTGGHGHTFPGAALPFGMVQLSPDTFNDGWDW